MKLLALDTSNSFLSLSILYRDQLFSFHEDVEQKHAERTLPEVSLLIEQAGLKLNELDAIVFGQGPGSFTGLRIACGIAQGLAFSANLPVIGIPTLDNLAAQANQGTVMACIDARMGQVYSAAYHTRTTSWERFTPINLSQIDELNWPEGLDHIIGDGFSDYTNQQAHLQSIHHTHARPHAEYYIQLALTGRYPQLHPREAELLYIRNKIALTAAEQQARRG